MQEYRPELRSRKFRRSRTDRMLAGVCGGAARLLGVDAAIIRIVMVIATLFSVGFSLLLYLACWVLFSAE